MNNNQTRGLIIHYITRTYLYLPHQKKKNDTRLSTDDLFKGQDGHFVRGESFRLIIKFLENRSHYLISLSNIKY